MDNKFLKEDFERALELDGMYAHERQKLIEEEWWQCYCEEMDKETRLPALIRVMGVSILKPKEQ